MKQYLYITLLLLYCWTGNAQNRVEAKQQSDGRLLNPIISLKSSNGIYTFEPVKNCTSTTYPNGYTEYECNWSWVIKNIVANTIIYKTKPIYASGDPFYPFGKEGEFFLEYLNLYFNIENSFKINNSSVNLPFIKDKEERAQYPEYYANCVRLNYWDKRNIPLQNDIIPVPYISAVATIKYNNYSVPCWEIVSYTAKDIFGIEGVQYSQTTYNTNPELASSMVYQDRGDGVYTVPEYYRAKALILTDEGDLQIVNTKEQVIWSLKQSQLDDKHFIAKGNTDPIKTASLVHTPEGHIELSNSKYQQEFDLTFLAKDYVLLSASNNKASELSVTSPNSMISMQVYQDSPTVSTAKSGLTSKSSTAKISPNEAPKLLVIPDQKNGIRNIAKIETKKTAKTAKIVKIEKPMPTNSFTVFPNPVKDIINIVFDDTTETLTKLQILSLDGRIIREFTGSQTPNIQELSSGMYLYLIESTKNKYNGKIIKQ